MVTGGQHAASGSRLRARSTLRRICLLRRWVHRPTPRRLSKRRRGKKRARKVWSKKQARLMLSSFSITVVPVSNPDGYVYSWDKNRMWRKNRQPNHFPSGLFCKGVDINRNYDYGFASSSNACSEMYPGSAAFSSAEARAIATTLKMPQWCGGLFDLHSYGQLMMYPFSSDCALQPADEEDLLEASLVRSRQSRRWMARRLPPERSARSMRSQGECGRLGLRCFQGLKGPTKGKSQVVLQYRTQRRWNVWIFAAKETDRAGSKRG